MNGLVSLIQIKLTDTTLKRSLLFVFHVIVGLVIFYFLYNTLRERLKIPFTWPEASWRNMVFFGLVLVLVPVNWMLEAVKWGFLTGQKSYNKNINQVLKGIALNIILPFTTGDVIARMGDFKNPGKRALAIALNRTISLSVTLLFGIYGLLGYFHHHHQVDLGGLIIIFPFLCLCMALLLPLLKIHYSKVILFTIIRYTVFFTQYFLLMGLFNPALPIQIIIFGISWVFLIKSIVPGILGSLGIREASAVFFFSLWVADPLKIVTPSLIIWLVNLVVPSIVGAGLFIIQNEANK